MRHIRSRSSAALRCRRLRSHPAPFRQNFEPPRARPCHAVECDVDLQAVLLDR